MLTEFAVVLFESVTDSVHTEMSSVELSEPEWFVALSVLPVPVLSVPVFVPVFVFVFVLGCFVVVGCRVVH